MAKLVATYAAGMFAVFTEDRTGMRQRALIDIGDNTPTPIEMAELAGVLSDQWKWQSIETPRQTVKPKAIDSKRPYTKPNQSGEPVGEIRNRMILDYVATHSGVSAREILEGLGWEYTQARISRWQHAFTALVRANQIIAETIGPGQRKGYSLPK